jgi:CPA1 family monovalent cation:H+ antiporter
MSPVAAFEFTLLLLVAVLGLEVLAKVLRLPPAAALIAGGIVLAFVPGCPAVSLDPDLVLVLFLPPLLMDGAYFTAWTDFRRNLGGILLLAIGAVAFTTLVVGLVAHWIVPDLPWAACFALGAVVSPPDAIAAKAVLERVALPRRLMVLLEGESLLNDAAGLVLFRFAVAAAMTGAFSIGDAVVTFSYLALGGLAVGGVLGFLWVKSLRWLKDPSLTIVAAVLLPWAAYIGGEALHVSGVIATVAAGLMLGWYQHEVFSAAVRTRGGAFWHLVIFLLEALVFILIGLSLRGVIERLGGVGDAATTLAIPVLSIVVAVVLSRFAWMFASDGLRAIFCRVRRRRQPRWLGSSAVMSWAGMRGVVTLAIALSLPEAMPGRDLILAAAFAVILVTVMVQGTTIGALIGLLRLRAVEAESVPQLRHEHAMARMAAAQLAVVERLSQQPDGSQKHPRLLEQYGHRARLTERSSRESGARAGDRKEHFEAVLAAIAAGRAEIVRLHRSRMIHDEVLRTLESDLDLQELAARAIVNEAGS